MKMYGSLPESQAVLDYEIHDNYYKSMKGFMWNILSWNIIKFFDTYYSEWTWELMRKFEPQLVRLHNHLHRLRKARWQST